MIIRDLTSEDLALFGNIVSRLERVDDEVDIRASIFPDLVTLTRADMALSCVWDEGKRRFGSSLLHNMDTENIKRYNNWYQFHDPHTFKLRALRRAAYVEEVMPYSELYKTEFYNDFLKRDGLHHGINIFLFDGKIDLCDFRLWRDEKSPEFSAREIMLMTALEPFIKRSLIRSKMRFEHLTPREREIAFLVARGCRDQDIATLLKISFSTVRTHINRAMEKKGCANRAELAAAVMPTQRSDLQSAADGSLPTASCEALSQ